jgi:hypothetical protein
MFRLRSSRSFPTRLLLSNVTKFPDMTILSSTLATVDLPVTLVSLLVVSVLYFCYVTVYRLILSPIAHFPGPKLAAWTYWYEFWYDVVAEPEYTFKIGRLHKEYGRCLL